MQPPMEFLLTCSRISLGDFELAALNRAAKLRKQVRAHIAEMIDVEAQAMLARWLIDNREDLIALGRTGSLQKTLDFVEGPRF